jgi:hypothetical protein
MWCLDVGTVLSMWYLDVGTVLSMWYLDVGTVLLMWYLDVGTVDVVFRCWHCSVDVVCSVVFYDYIFQTITIKKGTKHNISFLPIKSVHLSLK